MLKKLVATSGFRKVAATLLAAYFRLVHATCRKIVEPAGFIEGLRGPRPLIVTTWHGEHFMVPFVVPSPAWRPTAMISRSRDGELNAMVAEKLGAATIRASGGRSGEEVSRRGGVRGFVEVLKALQAGKAVMITADVPKTAKVAGEGIIQMARRSGVPILPFAAVTSRRRRMTRSWDRAAFNLPFGRFVTVFADPIEVPADADEAMIEAKRLELETTLNRLLAEAYERAGGRDG